MMVIKILLLVLASSLSFNVINAQQPCIPAPVENVVVLPNNILTWEHNPVDQCPISHFVVSVHRFGNEDIVLMPETNSVDIGFLEPCIEWLILVWPVSLEEISGLATIALARTLAPPDVNLGIRELRVEDNPEGGVRLTWELEDEIHGRCADFFHVIVHEQRSEEALDIYVVDRVLNLDRFLASCSDYEFSVSAIHRDFPTEAGPVRSLEYETPPDTPEAPRLLDAHIGATSAETAWLLEDPHIDKCPLHSFHLDAGDRFNIVLPIPPGPEGREPMWVNLTSLTADTFYLIRASVESIGGVSHPATIGIQTSDLDPPNPQ